MHVLTHAYMRIDSFFSLAIMVEVYTNVYQLHMKFGAWKGIDFSLVLKCNDLPSLRCQSEVQLLIYLIMCRKILFSPYNIISRLFVCACGLTN